MTNEDYLELCGNWAEDPNPDEYTGPTKLVNIKLGEKFDVYIGREGHGMDGYWGNPYRSEPPNNSLKARIENIEKFKRYFQDRLERVPGFREKIESLRGKRLGCFCAPAPCHGQVYLDYLDQFEQNP